MHTLHFIARATLLAPPHHAGERAPAPLEKSSTRRRGANVRVFATLGPEKEREAKALLSLLFPFLLAFKPACVRACVHIHGLGPGVRINTERAHPGGFIAGLITTQ